MWVAIASISGGDRQLYRQEAKRRQPAADSRHAVWTDACMKSKP